MRQDARVPPYKDKASQAALEESYSALKVDFAERFQSAKPDVTVNGGDSCGVEHISVAGLPRLGGSAHASVGNGHVHVAAVVGARVLGSSLIGSKASGLVVGGVHTQTYRCCQIIEQVLLLCQAQWADLVRLTVHMPDLGESALEAFEQAADYFFQERGCPSVAISVVGCAQLLLSAAVQIEGTAVHRSSSFSPERPEHPQDNSRWEAATVGGTSVSTAASNPWLIGRWRSRESSVEQRAAATLSSGSPSPPQQQNSAPGGWPCAPVGETPVLAAGQPQGTSALRRPTPAERHQRSRPPPSSRRGGTSSGRGGAVAEERRSGASEDLDADARAELPPPPGGGDAGRGRELSPALRWLSQSQDQPEPSTLISSAQAAQTTSASLWEEQLFLSTSQMDELSRQLGLSGCSQAESVAEGEGGEVEAAAPRRPRRTWVQKSSKGQAAEEASSQAAGASATASTSAASASLDPAAPNFWPRGETSGNAFLREGSPLTGHEQSLNLQELPADQARQLGLRFQGDHSMLWRVHMEASDTCRTVRLGPGELLCKHLVGCKRVWSYTFDVVLAHTLNSFVNVGLVEWVAAQRDGRSTESLMGMARGSELTLADLMGVDESEARGANLAWQHASESPRQMMLGCRKGVKWYGNSGSEPVFNDDFCDGSLLHFRCDYTFSPEGVPIQVRLWLLPSPVVFKAKGHQVVTLSGPLFEYAMPSSGATGGERPATRSLWVPAVTLYNQHDTVLFAWRGSARGRADGPGLGLTPGGFTQSLQAAAREAMEIRGGADGVSVPLLQAERAQREVRRPSGARSPRSTGRDEHIGRRTSGGKSGSRHLHG